MAPATIPMTLGTIFPALSLAAVVGRFVSRRKRKMPLRPDDFVIVVALMFSVGNGITMLYGAVHGNLGKPLPLNSHGAPILTEKYRVFKQCVYANEILTTVAIASARLSILLFYHKIFIGRLFEVWVWTLYFLNGAWGIAYTFVFIFPCKPIHTFWELARGSSARHCFPLYIQDVYAISSVIIDALMLLIPWPQVLRMMMSRREKAAVLGIFGLGTIVIGVAIAKTHEFFKVAEILKNGHHSKHDEATAFYYGTVESCVAVVCACLPTMKPLFESVSFDSFVVTLKSLVSGGASTASKRGSDVEKGSDRAAYTPSDGASPAYSIHGGVNGVPALPDLPPFLTDKNSEGNEEIHRV